MTRLSKRWFLWIGIVEMVHATALLVTGNSRFGAAIIAAGGSMCILAGYWTPHGFYGHAVNWWNLAGGAMIVLAVGMFLSFVEWGLLESSRQIVTFALGPVAILTAGFDLLFGGRFVYPDIDE